MKATGIVRRIDDLGRVVIPKEIRRTLNIREGDPLEIYVDGDGIIFRHYTPWKNMSDQVQYIRDIYADSMGIDLTPAQSEIIQQMDNLIKLLKQETKK